MVFPLISRRMLRIFLAASEANIGWREIVQTLVLAGVIVALDIG
jgi:hypothetical protein